MTNLVTYNGRTLEFLELEGGLLHLKPRSSVLLSDADLVVVREKYPHVFAHMFVHPRAKAKKVDKGSKGKVVDTPVDPKVSGKDSKDKADKK